MLKLRMQQQNFIMAASVNLPFSAEINDPPITPSRPTWPNTLIVGVIILLFVGGLAAWLGVRYRPYQAIRGRFQRKPAMRTAVTAARSLRSTSAGN